jgi:hypothetical protein
MLEAPVDSVRLRACCGPACGALFSVCVSCDRGQRYCSDLCRKGARQAQVRAASRRYQSSGTGKQAHRCRQRAYRERCSTERVTHQALASVSSADQASRQPLPSCVICGHASRWIDPFPTLPLHLRRRRRWRGSANVQKTTFPDDR